LDTIKIVRTLKQAFVTLGNYVFKLDTSEYSQPHRKHAFLDYDVLFQEISEIPLNDTENIIYQTKIRSFEELRDYFMEKHPEFEESLNEVSLSFLEEIWDSVQVS